MQVRIGILKVISYVRYSHLHIYSLYTFPLSNGFVNRKHIAWLVLPTKELFVKMRNTLQQSLILMEIVHLCSQVISQKQLT